jgi:hypothetical protein
VLKRSGELQNNNGRNNLRRKKSKESRNSQPPMKSTHYMYMDITL